MKTSSLKLTLLAGALALAAVPAHALSISGTINFENSARVRFLWLAGETTFNGSTAAGLDFNTTLAYNAIVTSATGDFSGLSTAQFQDFWFNTNPATPTLIWSAGSYTFFMETVSSALSGNTLTISGDGYAASSSVSPVYANTPGIFTMNVLLNRYGTGVSGLEYDWESVTTVGPVSSLAVPEGGSLLASFGAALALLALLGRRAMRA